MRENEGGIMAAIPHSLSEVTAVSRDEPQPKFLPATMKSPGLTSFANSGLCSTNAALASSFASVVMLYLPGVIRSVFIEFPNFHTLMQAPLAAQLPPTYFLGSAILPSSADAIAVAGEARYIFALGEPILPVKFLLEVETHTSPSDSTPMCRPRHAPHPGGAITAPALENSAM